MRHFILTACFLCVLQWTALAQYSIEGRIVSQDGRAPLPFANVFLSNTTRGVQADDKGKFQLNNLSAGVYELVASYLGHETFTIRIRPDTLHKALLIMLTPKANELQEVKIKRLRNGYELYFPLFKELFIGQTGFSNDCKLKNPKALWFSESDDKLTLSVNADDVLVIENKALGYVIKYQLEDFTYNFKSHYLSVLGYPFFEEMSTKSEKQYKRWAENRRKAYLGSMQHFMKCLLHDSTHQAGYTMYKLIRQPKKMMMLDKIPPKKDSLGRIITVGDPQKVWMDSTDLALRTDSTLRKVPASPFSNYVQYLVKNPLVPSSLFKQEGAQAQLTFKDYLYVVYQKEDEEPQFLERNLGKLPQVSIAFLIESFAIIEANGYLQDPLALLVEGRWGREKMGELLPIDYKP
ncbi:MAG: carboxypeptidase-like regulatory domain-containing protein [Spirosomataceae bacterium]